MSDIFDEVEEDLRNERMRRLWRAYAPFGAVLLALIIAVVGGREFMAWRTSQASLNGGALYASAMDAMDDGRLAEAEVTFAALAEQGRGGYPAIAQMHRAELALREGDRVRAAEHFAAAAVAANDPLTRDLATLKGVLVRADSLELSELTERLAPLADPDRPLHLAAREILGAGALAANDLNAARERYQYLTLAPEAPPAMRKRAEEAMAVIEARAPAPALASPTDSPSTPIPGAPAPAATGDDLQ